ncbi:MAG: SAM-dependent methyltransferase [Pirellulaceae bacterium]
MDVKTIPRHVQQLGVRASARFAWHFESTKVAGRERLFATATTPDQLLVDACRRQEAGQSNVEDPYWAAVWQAAVGLDDFMDSMELTGQHVLEVGAGTGRAGLAAALRGADVTITDGMTDPLLLVQLSTWDLPQCQVRQLRWNEQRLGRRFSIILGSDVTYNRQLWPLLEVSLKQHLQSGGIVLLSDPCRFISNEFRTWIQTRGWLYEESFVPHCQDSQRSIRVMQLRRR